MPVAAGQPYIATLPAPATPVLGARLERPLTGELVVARTAGVYDAVTGSWSVTLDAPDDDGAYLVVWDDALVDGFEAYAPIEVSSTVPTLDEVAALLVARTGRAIDDPDTEEPHTFTESTTPTAARVLEFIDVAVTDVAARVEVPILPNQAKQARKLAAYWASVLAEQSTVPAGAADEDRSVAPQYGNAYRAGLEDLKAACLIHFTRLA